MLLATNMPSLALSLRRRWGNGYLFNAQRLTVSARERMMPVASCCALSCFGKARPRGVSLGIVRSAARVGYDVRAKDRETA